MTVYVLESKIGIHGVYGNVDAANAAMKALQVDGLYPSAVVTPYQVQQ